MSEMNDSMTADGANAIAASIRAYWAERGYEVSTLVEPIRTDGKKPVTVYTVRSDMVNGWPVKTAKREAA